MSGQKIKLLVVGGAVLALFVWVIMTQGPLASVKVTVEQVQTGDLTSSVFGVGTVQARHHHDLAPTMTGRVKNVRVDQGDTVKAGQVLAEMDPVDLDDKQAGARRMVDKSINAIRAAEAQLSEARSRLKTVEATMVRYQELRSGGFVSKEMFDAKLHEQNAAQAAAVAAVANLASARDENARAQAELRGIGKTRAQMQLISPIDGIVTLRRIEPGSTVAGGQLALQVVDTSQLWVETRIAQQQAGQVHAGQAAQIVLRSRPHAPVAGKVARVDRVSDAVTEERIVNVTLDMPDASLGEFAEVTIALPVMKQVRSIPSAAVKTVSGQTGVWVLQDGEVRFKPVRIGFATLDGRSQILEGLDDGETVIVHSQQSLRAGLPVKVVAALVRG
ncbi:MAG: efflux RND transporter periplasmic adaptor subunit [Gammaproteobacteria bacterium]|nr:efflux RND transporter periplasmic adaptor subunit [Sideroxydans sp.]MBU3902875.1 efflux RND transporter periplasmic adaptor subunit [Gammaproteobacteria bacterium]MBU4045953.1 efflux RND transporter periplasmic adaptor subunit [Gammaproteobacteria bacterium]MBU4150039.1 efflux RND transporter periplasmic adaptor subunit [Gammaproteobacteria bacterium]